MLRKFAVALLALPMVAAPAAAASGDGPPLPTRTIVPGAAWSDDTGRMVQAHGAGVIKVGSTFYMYGEDKTAGGKYTAVSCYSSQDLVSWRFGGNALSLRAEGDLGPNRIVERPKVLHNEATGQYVMYLHIDDLSYQEARVGLAVSDTPCGPFTYRGSFRPLGFQSRDIGVFKDDDGTSYLLTEDRVNGLRIERLSPDYLTIEGTVAILRDLESPAMLKHNGRYFMFASQMTGFNTNDNLYATATSLEGPWSDFTTFAPAGSKTHNSQTSTIVPIAGSRGTTFVFVGDRWLPHDLFHSPPVWLPLTIDGTTARLDWHDSWSLDLSAGTWTPQNADRVYEGESTFDIEVATPGVYTMKVTYHHGESSDRVGTLQVDGQAPVRLAFPPTGSRTGVAVLAAELGVGKHTVEISGWTSGIDRIALPDGPGTRLGITRPASAPITPDVDNPITVALSNFGPIPVKHAAISINTPGGWAVSPISPVTTATVGIDQTLTTHWSIRPPAGTASGRYPVTATATYQWNGQPVTALGTATTITVFQPPPPGTRFVSDLPWLSASNGWGPVERDLSNGEAATVDGQPITIGGVVYTKGLGAHAPSSVRLRLPESCRTFAAVVGLDDEVGEHGSVVFEVWADGRKIAESNLVRGTDPGATLAADLTGAVELELRLTDGRDGNAYDHADWADARITC